MKTGWIAVALGLVIALPLVLIALISSDTSGSGCEGTDSGAVELESAATPTLSGYSPQQLHIAGIAVAVGEQRGMSPNVIMAALMAADQESNLRNLSNPSVPGSEGYRTDPGDVGSDHDSVGPWQMRMSVWGSAGLPQLMSPAYQANWWFSQAARIPGADTMDPGQLAQAVEGSKFPDAYGAHQQAAQAMYSALRGAGVQSPNLVQAVAGDNHSDQGQQCGTNFGAAVVAAAMRWIGSPYVWGGGDVYGPTRGLYGADSPGFDCSGLALFAIAAASGGQITLSHTTGAQVGDSRGAAVSLDEKKPGDLIFFGTDVHHVAVYYGEIQGKPMVVNAPDFGENVRLQPLWTSEPMVVRTFDPSRTHLRVGSHAF